MTKPAVFTQSDITKLLKAAKATGETIRRVQIDRFGNIVADFGKPDDEPSGETSLDRIIRAQKEQASTKRH